jgi:ribosome biogenesis GTPase
MKLKDQDLLIARVTAQHRGKYRVIQDTHEYWAEITGQLMYNAESETDYPTVGDLVKIYKLEDDHAVICEILPRKTLLQRKAAGKDNPQNIAANIDAAFVVQAVDRDFNLNRFDRYLSIIYAGNIKPIIILNKSDLISAAELEEKKNQVAERFPNIEIITTTTVGENGIKALSATITPGQIYCLLGSSGVGKSSIMNQLLGDEVLKTKEISSSTNKGKHTTTHRELFVLKTGAIVIDNPGLREIGLTDAEAGVASVFSEITELAESCKFPDCTHEQEPGCAVKAALQSGELSESKYQNYLKLKKEADYYKLTALEKKNRDRRFGKMVKEVKKYKIEK